MKPTTQNKKEILSRIQRLAPKYSTWRVFEDFLERAAISLSNAIDWIHREDREKQYLETVKKYSKEELALFPEMFAHLVEELELYAEAPEDVLGGIFHELELHNKYKGQFFTPQHICDFMGMISLSEHDPDIAKKGFLSVCEPCAGAGAMILGFAKAMKKNGHDFRRQMVVTATDIDLKCVYMCFIQLSLYGIPAVVIHGNTLTVKEWSRWYTPVYILDGWLWRQQCGELDKTYPDDEALKRATDTMYAGIRQSEALISSDSVDGKSESVIKEADFVNETSKSVNDKPYFDIALREGKNGQMSFVF